MSSTAFMFGSSTDDSEPLSTGRTAPLAPALFATSEVTRNFTKSTASGGASLPIAKPSPPPNCSSAEPAPPSTVGNGNQPTSGAFSSLALAAKVDGAHWPMRSIAARPLPIVAASPPDPSHGAARKPSWNGCMSISRWSSSPALTKPSLSNEPSSPACCIASLPAMRSDRLAHQNIPGHLSFSPSGDRGDAGGLELLDRGEELVPRGGRLARCPPSRRARCCTRPPPCPGCRGCRTACRRPGRGRRRPH